MESLKGDQPLSNAQRIINYVDGLKLLDGEIITERHLAPIIGEIKQEQGLLAALEALDGIAGMPYISPDRTSQNIEYLEDFGPQIPFE